MKNLFTKRLTKLWALFFLIHFSSRAAPLAPIEMTEEEKLAFAARSADFEFGGTYEGITMWNEGESFPSFGIGHYIWFPEYKDPSKVPPFQQSFPLLVKYMVDRGLRPSNFPAFMKVSQSGELGTAAPWASREEFYQEFHGHELNSLREFLHVPAHKILQVEYQIDRLKLTLDRILELHPEASKMTIFLNELGADWRGVFALVDYVNFKGEGLNSKERVEGPKGQLFGWGLMQVLEEAVLRFPNSAPLSRFQNSARYVLQRRVRYRPQDQRFLAGWMNRIARYSE